ncbi:type II toxin-antitoxin system antitoxin DNA ADP-ribosyl glycohydrolase DarG [Lysobacter gummosus]|uniref:Macro domain-containing protein n=1 Tax=Lysobacter gummosus TaxID=262324 RepID=A0ABY3XCC1_9GAMM|nr:macro domain-containing protein [Lysobacter gummosus]UNP28071.1 macro domain-containing protein [Lysobacter gummosus]
MIKITRGNLLKADVDALVNTVNTQGVMGKGIALQFKRAFPKAFAQYEAACARGEVKVGHVHIVDAGGLVGGPKWIVNFPTKAHWRAKSKLVDIKTGLVDLVAACLRLEIRSIAVPPLGCGLGGLSWSDVRPLIERAFEAVPQVDVHLYPPEGAPLAVDMPTNTKRPEMTAGRAALVSLIRRYQDGLMDPFVSLLEVHKLMYFLQEAGQPLRLQYTEGRYGPYAKNLRQVLICVEGHYLQGYGDGADSPTKIIDIMDGAVEAAENFLRDMPDVGEKIERVASLIDGYEDAYGLELLSSVHWVMCQSAEARDSAEGALQKVHEWNDRKSRLLKPEHIRQAWSHLHAASWGSESRSAIH